MIKMISKIGGMFGKFNFGVTAYMVIAIMLLSSLLLFYVKKSASLNTQLGHVTKINKEWANRYKEVPKYFNLLDDVDVNHASIHNGIKTYYADTASRLLKNDKSKEWNDSVIPEYVFNGLREYIVHSNELAQNDTSKVSPKRARS